MNEKLHQILQELAERRRRKRLHSGMAIVWWASLVIGVLLIIFKEDYVGSLLLLLGLAAIASVLVYFLSRRGIGDSRQMAHEIEKRYPELETGLLAALDQNPDENSGAFSYLQEQLIFDSLASASRQNWTNFISSQKVAGLTFLNISGALLFLIALTAVLIIPKSNAINSPEGYSNESLDKAAPQTNLEIKVEPGDVEVAIGEPLSISASIEENLNVPVYLEKKSKSGEVERIQLIRPLADPVYQTRLNSVAEPFTYSIIVGESKSEEFEVKTYQRPTLLTSKAVLYFPKYAEKESKTLLDPTVIHIPEGTKIDLSLETNLPNLSAELVAKKHETLSLKVDEQLPKTHTLSFTPSKSVRYEIILRDEKRRRNGRRDTLNIKVTQNKAPVIKVILPNKKEQVTPIQELEIEAKVIDKTGLIDYGMRYTLDGDNWIDAEVEVDLKNPKFSQVIDLEAAGAQPNDLIMWNAWAKDIKPDGSVRHVDGDLHVIYVRTFDQKFFRGMGSAPMPAEGEPPQDLIKLQKKVIDATWNINREHTQLSDHQPKSEELETLQKSQDAIIEIVKQTEALVPDPIAGGYLRDARLEMSKASIQLKNALSLSIWLLRWKNRSRGNLQKGSS